MATYKGIYIPEIVSPDTSSGNEFAQFVGSFGSSLIKSWLYGHQKAESDSLKADVTLYSSAVNAAADYKEPEPVQELVDWLNTQKEGVGDDPLRSAYVDSSLRKVNAKLFNLKKEDELRTTIQTFKSKFDKLEGTPGYREEAPKLLNDFMGIMLDEEQYQSQLMKEKSKNIRDEVLYTLHGEDLMNAIDDDIIDDEGKIVITPGIQINAENYPNDESLLKTKEALRYIEEAREIQSITGEFDKPKYQAAFKLYKESLSDRGVGNAKKDRIARELKKNQVRIIKKGAAALEKAFILPKGKELKDVYGKFIGDLGINTNIEKIIDVGETAYSKERGLQARNYVLMDVAKILEKSGDLPSDLTKSFDRWKGDNYVPSSIYLDDIFRQLAYWKDESIVTKDMIEKFDFPGVDFLGFEGKNTKVKNLVMQYMDFIKLMDETHTVMFPDLTEAQKKQQKQTVSTGKWGGYFD